MAGCRRDAQPGRHRSLAQARHGSLIDSVAPARRSACQRFRRCAVGDRSTRQLFDELEEALILADVGLRDDLLLDPLRAEFKAPNGEPEAVLAALERRRSSRSSTATTHAPSSGMRAPVGLAVRRRERRRQDDHDRQAREPRDRRRATASCSPPATPSVPRPASSSAIWAERTGADIVQGADGADPSSVIFDAIAHAGAVGADLVLADTAGRLHTKTNLMEELKKVRRVADRPPGHVTEVLLVIDATTGQNGLAQAREFAEAVGVTGVVLTKLDGTAKGGIVLAIRSELGLPIKLVGLGEGVDDLVDLRPRGVRRRARLRLSHRRADRGRPALRQPARPPRPSLDGQVTWCCPCSTP